MKLLLIRHGQAGKQNLKRYPDDDLRPLTAKGRKLSKHALGSLTDFIPNPHLILTSPALRCIQTAKLVAQGFQLDSKNIREIPELHHSIPAPTALAKLSRMKLSGRLVMVGHEPWLGELVTLLIAGTGRAGIEIGKGGAAYLTLESLKPGKGRLLWLLTQDQLTSIA